MLYSVFMRNVLKQGTETLNDVSTASKRVVETTELASVALLAVAGVSLLAVVIALIALERSSNGRS